MPSTEARITTGRAGRYLAQLCRHLGEMGRMHGAVLGHGAGGMPKVEHVERSDDAAVVRFPRGTCTLRATPDALLLRIDAEDAATLSRLQRGFANRVQTIGRREDLRADWQAVQVTGSAPARPTRSSRGTPDRRRTLLAIAAVAAVVLVVGVHLAIGGALVAAPWAGLAGGALVGAVALAGVVVAAHLTVGGATVSGVRLAHGRRRPAVPPSEERER